MEIVKKFFPEIMQDNDMIYFARLEGMIDSIDELSALQITKSSYSYQFRLAPSHPKYIEMLLEEVLKFHNIYNIRLNLSKSIKTTGSISFEIILYPAIHNTLNAFINDAIASINANAYQLSSYTINVDDNIKFMQNKNNATRYF